MYSFVYIVDGVRQAGALRHATARKAAEQIVKGVPSRLRADDLVDRVSDLPMAGSIVLQNDRHGRREIERVM
jgi:hypothetical protein